MKSPTPEHLVPKMTIEAATEYASRLHRHVEEQVPTRDPDEIDWAFERFERMWGVGRWTLEHLRKGRAKTCDVTIFARLRAAYLGLCEQQLGKLQHQIAQLKATGDDDLTDLEGEARRLAEKIEAKKAAAQARRDARLRGEAE
jgi:nucleotidyltransferase/DNA polymerase involved in DNA repair